MPGIHSRWTVAGVMGLVALSALALKAHEELGRRRYCLDRARKHASAATSIQKALGVRVFEDGRIEIGQKFRARALRDAENHDRMARGFEHAAWRPWARIPSDEFDPSVHLESP